MTTPLDTQVASKKAHGVHETPPALAAFLAERMFKSLAGDRAFRPGFRAEPAWAPITVLDPACGGGNLLAAFARAAPEPLRRQFVLAGCERDPLALERARATLEPLAIRALDLNLGDFLDRIVDPTSAVPMADVVIANPPYVRTQVLGATRSRSLSARFGLSGRVDLYQAFLHAIVGVLRPGGMLGLLTSNRFLTVRAGGDVRRTLGSEFDLLDVIDLGDTRLFPGASVLPVIVVARRLAISSKRSTPRVGGCSFTRVYECRKVNREPRTGVNVSDDRDPDGPPPTFENLFAALDASASGPVEVQDRRFVIERGELATVETVSSEPAAPWTLSHPSRRAWVARIEARRVAVLGDVGKVRVGIKTTADAVFLRDDWDELPSEMIPETELLRPIWTHREAARWAARLDPTLSPMRVLYPHRTGPDGRRDTIDLNAYPRTRVYLETHRARLEGRRYVVESGRRWFEIWVPQDPAGWSAPKIVFPDIAERPRAFLDTAGTVVNGDCYWLAPGGSKSHTIPLELVLAVLNSTLATAYYDALFHNKLYAGRRRFITQYVATFPLPDPRDPSAVDAARIAALLAAETRALDASEIARLDDDCDRLIWHAFGLERPSSPETEFLP